MAKEKSLVQLFTELSNKQDPKDLIAEFFIPEMGKPLIGILIGVEVVINEKITEPCNRYILETDDGTKSVLLGAATDKQLEGKMHIGHLTYIEFQGKVEIQNGAKMVNRWKILQVSLDGQKNLDLGN